jgi:hypothetical protein
MSVHLNIITNYRQQDATFLDLFIYLFLKTLYMFQAVPPSIIRSTQLYKQLQLLSSLSLQLAIPEAVCTVMMGGGTA